MPLEPLEPLPIRLWKRQGRACAYCKCGIRRKNITIDHVVPRSRGGANDETNKVVSCKACNNSKGDLLLSEWVDNILSVFHMQADLESQVWKGLVV